eukprot:8542613-Alexandrium_andersonii.AAC.1
MAVGRAGFRGRRTAEVSLYAFPCFAHVAPCIAQCCWLRRGWFPSVVSFAGEGRLDGTGSGEW